MGDDLLMVLTSDTSHSDLAGIEASYGIDPEYVSPATLEESSFISCSWVLSQGKYVFYPLIGRMLAKLWWTVNPPSKRGVQNYRNGIAHGILSTYAGFPIIDGFLRPAMMSVASDDPSGPHRIRGKVDIDTESVAHGLSVRYGLTPADVMRLDAWLSVHPQTPGFSMGDPNGDVARIIVRDMPKAIIGEDARVLLEGWRCFDGGTYVDACL